MGKSIKESAKKAKTKMDEAKENIVAEGAMMGYKVVHSVKEGYTLKVVVPERTVNMWNLGHDEKEAKAKVVTILASYKDGLEYVQDQVRNVFAKKSDEEPK